jgi:hypothetical protein
VKFLVGCGSLVSDSNFLNNSHNVVVLGNLSVSLEGLPSDSGSCRATDTTDGDLESTTSWSLAPEERPESLKGWDRSMFLLLLLKE